LLKIIAIQVFGRKKVASLFGMDWFGFLQQSTDKKLAFSKGSLEDYSNAIYRTNVSLPDEMVDEFKLFAIQWIKYHRRNV
jgi:hypothetical protein